MDFPVVEQNITFKLSEKYKNCILAKKQIGKQINTKSLLFVGTSADSEQMDGVTLQVVRGRANLFAYYPVWHLRTLNPRIILLGSQDYKGRALPPKNKIKTFAIRRWIIIGI